MRRQRQHGFPGRETGLGWVFSEKLRRDGADHVAALDYAVVGQSAGPGDNDPQHIAFDFAQSTLVCHP